MSTSGRGQSPSSAPKEWALLRACARAELSPEDTQAVRALLDEETDWGRLVEMAQTHGVLPLLYHSLSALPESVPSDTLETLRKRFRANALRNLVLARDLIRVLRALDAANVSGIAYKGPLLAQSVYGDLSLRQFADLDVLVRRRDLNKAREALGAIGYALRLEGGISDASYLQSMHHYTYQRNEAVLELHWGLTENYFPFRLKLDELWQRARTGALAQYRVLDLAPEDLLLILCVHGSKHGWERLAMVCDVAELVQRAQALDWVAMRERARSLGAERMLLLGMRLARDLLGAELSEVVTEAVEKDPTLPRLASKVSAELAASAGPHPEGSERSRLLRFHLDCRERRRDRLSHLLRLAFVPSQDDWAAARLPPSLGFLYYVTRPLRLAVEYGRKRLGGTA